MHAINITNLIWRPVQIWDLGGNYERSVQSLRHHVDKVQPVYSYLFLSIPIYSYLFILDKVAYLFILTLDRNCHPHLIYSHPLVLIVPSLTFANHV